MQHQRTRRLKPTPIHLVPRVIIACLSCCRLVWETTTRCPHCGRLQSPPAKGDAHAS